MNCDILCCFYSEFNTEKMLVLNNLENLKNEIFSKDRNLKNLQEEIDNLSKENESLLAELNLLKSRELIINKESQNKVDTTNKIVKEYEDLKQENKKGEKRGKCSLFYLFIIKRISTER